MTATMDLSPKVIERVVTVAGEIADTGCYIDGSRGSVNAAEHLTHVLDCFSIGYTQQETPKFWRDLIERGVSDPVGFADEGWVGMTTERAWEQHEAAGDALLDRLNENTVNGTFYWDCDGNLMLELSDLPEILDGITVDEVWEIISDILTTIDLAVQEDVPREDIKATVADYISHHYGE